MRKASAQRAGATHLLVAGGEFEAEQRVIAAHKARKAADADRSSGDAAS